MTERTVNWPKLPTKGYIADRLASLEDVERGDAVFSMNGQGLRALGFVIPQYVWWSEKEGERAPMILVQAEESPDGPTGLVGLRTLDGETVLATLAEIELLGTEKPD